MHALYDAAARRQRGWQQMSCRKRQQPAQSTRLVVDATPKYYYWHVLGWGVNSHLSRCRVRDRCIYVTVHCRVRKRVTCVPVCMLLSVIAVLPFRRTGVSQNCNLSVFVRGTRCRHSQCCGRDHETESRCLATGVGPGNGQKKASALVDGLRTTATSLRSEPPNFQTSQCAGDTRPTDRNV